MFAYGFVVGHRGSWSHLCSNHMFCVCVCVCGKGRRLIVAIVLSKLVVLSPLMLHIFRC